MSPQAEPKRANEGTNLMKIQAFFLASAALGLAFATANGCTVTTGDTGSGGAGGTTGSGETTSGTGGENAAGVGGSGTTSAGGAGNCVTCAAVLTDGEGVPCGLSADGSSCDPGSSCEKLQKLSECACTSCADDCPVSCGTDENGDDSKCQDCAQSSCSAELTACVNDA